jgi:hypothetical protein
MIGDGHGRHFLPRRLIQQLSRFAGPIEKAVICVYVKVNELGLPHN